MPSLERRGRDKLLVAFFLTGCSSYLHSTREIACRLDHTYLPGKLTIEATVINNTAKSVTFVRNRNFYTLSVWARNRAYIEDKVIRIVDYNPASLASLEIVPPGKSIQFTENFEYRRISPRVIEIYDDMSHDNPLLRIKDSKLKVDFSYGFYPDYFPWLGRVLYPNILSADLKSSVIIDAP